MQALAAAKVAVARMEAAGTPWLRPPDYYAEMVKSDDHMAKVKEQLMYETKLIEEQEERCAPAPPEKNGHCTALHFSGATATCTSTCYVLVVRFSARCLLSLHIRRALFAGVTHPVRVVCWRYTSGAPAVHPN
jgi:Eukaryotic rRNA processing protein EBP2